LPAAEACNLPGQNAEDENCDGQINEGSCKYTAIVAGGNHSLALRSDGTVWAWGLNETGQLGDGSTTNRATPVAVKLDATIIIRIAGGGEYSMALTSDKIVLAWGDNISGQLGDGTVDNHITASLVPGLSSIDDIAAGFRHSLALKGDSSVAAWGTNYSGELGDGTTMNERWGPGAVQSLGNVVSVVAGNNHCLALRADGTVWAWGDNSAGQLGDNTIVDRATAFGIPGLLSASQVAAGEAFSVVRLSNQTIKTWGSNSSGQLGDGTNVDSKTPKSIMGINGAVGVAAGARHVLAIVSGGQVMSWGANDAGQLGDGTTTSHNTPALISTLDNVMTVAAGTKHSLALRTDGSVWAWGSGEFGQLGNGLTASKYAPVKVALP